jgi:hypothetical protein
MICLYLFPSYIILHVLQIRSFIDNHIVGSALIIMGWHIVVNCRGKCNRVCFKGHMIANPLTFLIPKHPTNYGLKTLACIQGDLPCNFFSPTKLATISPIQHFLLL